MPTHADFSALSQQDLVYVVRQLITEKKVTPDRVRALATGRTARIAELERELAALRGGAPAVPTAPVKRGPGRPPKAASAAAPAAAPAPAPKRAFTMTPKAKAARKLQGQYLGALKKLQGGA